MVAAGQAGFDERETRPAVLLIGRLTSEAFAMPGAALAATGAALVDLHECPGVVAVPSIEERRAARTHDHLIGRAGIARRIADGVFIQRSINPQYERDMNSGTQR